jgi:dihydropteroate synthase
MMRKIIRAINEAKETGFPVYVQNNKGVAIMRVRFDVHTKTVDFYAGNRNMGMVVKEAFSLFRKVHAPRKKKEAYDVFAGW